MTSLATPAESFLRLRDVRALTGLSRATIYRMQAAGRFPQRIAIQPRLTVWLETEVRHWMAEQVARARVLA
jgi:prophage regulatory protein